MMGTISNNLLKVEVVTPQKYASIMRLMRIYNFSLQNLLKVMYANTVQLYGIKKILHQHR